jgi:adenosylcobinamide kinase / adenosylcobinamide-phosphate guanylyltransferase
MIYLITGGERSGKSRYAQELALTLSNNPIYLATARKWDEDFCKRINRHQQERDSHWINLEEEKYISQLSVENKTVVIDCITLWLTNFYADTKNNAEESLTQAKEEFSRLTKIPATFIIITNELGMGVHAHTEGGRKFVELQGWMNQHIATAADKVILMISGIPVTIKG